MIVLMKSENEQNKPSMPNTNKETTMNQSKAISPVVRQKVEAERRRMANLRITPDPPPPRRIQPLKPQAAKQTPETASVDADSHTKTVEPKDSCIARPV
jgi:hypothetical protein